MFTRLLLSAVVLPIMTSPMENLSTQEPPRPSGSACLPVDSSDMQGLLSLIQFTVSHDGRGRLGAEHGFSRERRCHPRR